MNLKIIMTYLKGFGHSFPIIIFAILYCVIGVADLVGGATLDSRFYTFDNLLIKTIGAALIIISIGLFLRKEIARKGFIITLSLSIIELFIGIPQNVNTFEIIGECVISLLVYVPGIIYFSKPSIKAYFNLN